MPDEDIQKLVSESALSVTGTVERMGTSTLDQVPADAHTGVILVDRVLHSPTVFAHLAGTRITVQFDSNVAPPNPGERLAVFANGLAYGDTIAVTEVGRVPISEIDARLARVAAQPSQAPLSDLQRQLAGEQFRSHADSADAIVVGRVSALEKAGPLAMSEHDPDWWRATIDVQHVEKGDVPEQQVTVAFPSSQDVRWHTTPKPVAGQDGVWVLHATEGATRDIAPFQLADSEDFRSLQDLDLLRGREVNS